MSILVYTILPEMIPADGDETMQMTPQNLRVLTGMVKSLPRPLRKIIIPAIYDSRSLRPEGLIPYHLAWYKLRLLGLKPENATLSLLLMPATFNRLGCKQLFEAAPEGTIVILDAEVASLFIGKPTPSGCVMKVQVKNTRPVSRPTISR
jgi:hypothetical protein